jgi:hypothetical protein
MKNYLFNLLVSSSFALSFLPSPSFGMVNDTIMEDTGRLSAPAGYKEQCLAPAGYKEQCPAPAGYKTYNSTRNEENPEENGSKGRIRIKVEQRFRNQQAPSLHNFYLGISVHKKETIERFQFPAQGKGMTLALGAQGVTKAKDSHGYGKDVLVTYIFTDSSPFSHGIDMSALLSASPEERMKKARGLGISLQYKATETGDAWKDAQHIVSGDSIDAPFIPVICYRQSSDAYSGPLVSILMTFKEKGEVEVGGNYESTKQQANVGNKTRYINHY